VHCYTVLRCALHCVQVPITKAYARCLPSSSHAVRSSSTVSLLHSSTTTTYNNHNCSKIQFVKKKIQSTNYRVANKSCQQMQKQLTTTTSSSVGLSSVARCRVHHSVPSSRHPVWVASTCTTRRTNRVRRKQNSVLIFGR
jgi:hypothetical protein